MCKICFGGKRSIVHGPTTIYTYAPWLAILFLTPIFRFHLWQLHWKWLSVMFVHVRKYLCQDRIIIIIYARISDILMHITPFCLLISVMPVLNLHKKFLMHNVVQSSAWIIQKGNVSLKRNLVAKNELFNREEKKLEIIFIKLSFVYISNTCMRIYI